MMVIILVSIAFALGYTLGKRQVPDKRVGIIRSTPRQFLD